MPQTTKEWKDISNDFDTKWNFPNCLGAMDGKHITIVPPAGSGSKYYNYKGRHSMVLLAIADANYQFIMCDFGTNGRISDGGVLKNTKFFEKLEKKLLNIPEADKIRNSDINVPYVFVVDDAFPLTENMMKPFRQAQLNSDIRKIFNYRLSRARRIIENAFGILVARFRIFHTAINLTPEHIDSIVMASCVLHNFLLKMVPTSYAPPECFDRENISKGTISIGYEAQNDHTYSLSRTNQSGKPPQSAKELREEFMKYFTNEGQVPWQQECI